MEILLRATDERIREEEKKTGGSAAAWPASEGAVDPSAGTFRGGRTDPGAKDGASWSIANLCPAAKRANHVSPKQVALSPLSWSAQRFDPVARPSPQCQNKQRSTSDDQGSTVGPASRRSSVTRPHAGPTHQAPASQQHIDRQRRTYRSCRHRRPIFILPPCWPHRTAQCHFQCQGRVPNLQQTAVRHTLSLFHYPSSRRR